MAARLKVGGCDQTRGVYDFSAVGWVVRASSRAAEVGRSL